MEVEKDKIGKWRKNRQKVIAGKSRLKEVETCKNRYKQITTDKTGNQVKIGTNKLQRVRTGKYRSNQVITGKSTQKSKNSYKQVKQVKPHRNM